MSLLVLDGISLGFGARRIFDELSLRIGENDRIGIVGRNGAGKTTLLRVLAGEMKPDFGAVRPCRGLRIGYLPQDLDPRSRTPLLRYVVDSVPGRNDVQRAAEEAEAELRTLDGSGDEERLMEAATRVAEIHERLAHFDAHFSEHEAARILAGLGFSPVDADRPLDQLSGGWRMRAVLASLLFQQPDLLLLDEPTNHLDMPSVAWFSGFLAKSRRAIVMICHDREFLDEQIGRVVSFEPEGVRQYEGNYEHYRKQRAEEETVLANKARNLQREREQAERFIERFRAQASKARAVQSRIKALDRLEQVAVHEQSQRIAFRFPACVRAGARVLELTGVRKAYGERVIFPDLDLVVERGERIGIIGANGAGKTTLLKMMAGELRPDDGEIRLGHNVTVGYYAQHHAESLDVGRTVLEEVALCDPSAGPTRLRSILGAFLFREDDVDKRIGVLSGGERARVALARLLVRPGNLLLMDEPTNHLDLDSSEALADALTGFDGTLVFVSHNRSFVRRLASRIWDVQAGRVETYPGTLDEYLDRARTLADSSGANVTATQGGASAVVDTQPEVRKRSRADDRARKREAAERRALEHRRLAPLRERVLDLERRIAEVEARQKNRSSELADPGVYANDTRRGLLLDGFTADASRLDELTRAWELAQHELERTEVELRGAED